MRPLCQSGRSRRDGGSGERRRGVDINTAIQIKAECHQSPGTMESLLPIVFRGGRLNAPFGALRSF
ncbi:MAG TPA: hypothetical protein VFA47_09205 [Candidatus Manganitrophaceae bacterium]|nr:hypothetical protein [Candidatus Manganitrophaceae bacterium]